MKPIPSPDERLSHPSSHDGPDLWLSRCQPLRALVTGGAGFIGSHLVDALIGRGDEVVILDDLSTGSGQNLNQDARFVQGSVLDQDLVAREVSGCEVVFHLAAAVGVRKILDEPLKSFLTNIRGTDNVLSSAAEGGQRVFVASTSEIYGDSQRPPFREDAESIGGNPKVLRWGYSLSKAVDETLAFAYARERGLAVVIGRFFNTVGPRQAGTYGMVLPNFVRQATEGQDLTVFGDGAQSRCFCHVSDVIRAVLALVEEPVAMGDVFNIGSDEEVTIRDLAQKVIDLSGSTSRIRTISYGDAYGEDFADIRRRVPDISKIKSVVGWVPSFSLKEIITELVDPS